MILDSILSVAEKTPTKLALISDKQDLSYRAFAQNICAHALNLNQHQISPGKTVAIVSDDAIECWSIILAARHLGLNTILMPKAAQLVPSISDISHVIHNEKTIMSSPAMISFSSNKSEIILPDRLSTHDLDPSILTAPRPYKPGEYYRASSGTTGFPKVMFWPVASELEIAQKVAKIENFSDNTVVNQFDYSPASGMGFTFAIACWSVGGTLINGSFEKSITHLKRTTWVRLTPRYAKRLADEIPLDMKNENLQLSFGSGFHSWSAVEKLMKLTPIQPYASYGQNEIAIQRFRTPITSTEDIIWHKPLNGVDIVSEDGSICPHGIEGEVRLTRELYDCDHYVGDEFASAKVFKDGYCFPGDRAIQRSDGRVRFLGRVDDVISIKGLKMSVVPIEDDIKNLLGVANVCLFGRQTDDAVDEAVVVVESEVTPNAMGMNEVKRRLGLFDQVTFRVISNFPRTERGKIRRGELRAIALRGED